MAGCVGNKTLADTGGPREQDVQVLADLGEVGHLVQGVTIDEVEQFLI